MELSDYAEKLVRTAKLSHALPDPFTTDGVKDFGQIDEGRAEVSVLFLALLLELTCSRYVNCSTTFSEATLPLWQTSIFQVLSDAVEENSGKDLDSNDK